MSRRAVQEMEQIVPVGIFWDIENCPVPRNKSAGDVIDEIRNKFIAERAHHTEFEFLIGCTVSNTHEVDKSKLVVNLSPETVRDIDRKDGVFLVQVLQKPDAVDNKLIEGILKFVDTTKLVTTIKPVVVLVSGDHGFGKILFAIQRRGCDTILLHSDQCRPELKKNCTEAYAFQKFCYIVPQKCKDEPIKHEESNQPKVDNPGTVAPRKRLQIEPSKQEQPQQIELEAKLQSESPVIGPKQDLQSAASSANFALGFQLIVMGFPGKGDSNLLLAKLQLCMAPYEGQVVQVRNGQALINFRALDQADCARQFLSTTDNFGVQLTPSFTKNKNQWLQLTNLRQYY